MYSTDYLFATPSFSRGMASVLDLGATLTRYNISDSPEEADAKAIASDWGMVGQDIRFAISAYEKTNCK